MINKIKKINLANSLFIGGVYIYMLIKTYIYTAIITSYKGEYISKLKIDMQLLPAYIAMIFIVLIPVLIFKYKGKTIYLVILNLIYTIILYGDLLAYRTTSSYLGFKYLFTPTLFNPSDNFGLKILPIDGIVILDILIILGIYFIGKKVIEESKRDFIIPSIAIIFCLLIINSINNKENLFSYDWVDYSSMKKMSPIGYHFFEVKDVVSKQFRKTKESEFVKVDEWLDWNRENLLDNEYKGIFEGKNVVYIQAESLETSVIGKTVNGQEITPVLNSLVEGGIFFPNIYEQNSGGNSVDADLMVNSSVFTLEDSIAFLTDSETMYPLSMPRVLKNNGYITSNTLHVITSAEYKWAENHKHSLGFEEVWDINDFNMTFKVGNYYSDRELFEQQAEKIKDIEQPFFSMIPTATSHGPFYMKDDEFRYLNLTEEQNKNRLGEYFQMMKYLDTQIGHYLEVLKQQNQLDNTVFVIFGDHGGVHKYYREMIGDAPFEGDWWKEDSMTVPLIIYSTGGPVKTFETNGGLVDVMPTVLYTLGIEQDGLMGRNLLNTERNATVFTDRNKQKQIVGDVKSEEEKSRLLEAYDISRIIIKDRYYENRVSK